MGNRRKSRILAVQTLFCMDMRRDFSLAHLKLLYQFFAPAKDTGLFFVKLVKGVMRTRPDLDDILERFSSNWRISRMNCADRNILRVAAFEMLYCDGIPGKVSINEAIDLGKIFGTDESGAFVNGILDSIRIALADGTLVAPTPGPIPEEVAASPDPVLLQPLTGAPRTSGRPPEQPGLPSQPHHDPEAHPGQTARKPRRIMVPSRT